MSKCESIEGLVRPVGKLEKAIRVFLGLLGIKGKSDPIWLTESELADLTRRLCPQGSDVEGRIVQPGEDTIDLEDLGL